jgi:hypothetical protein
MQQAIEVLQANSAISRDQILRLQEAMIPLESTQPDPTHFFAPGMYLRELTVPAGMLMVGKIHKHAHFLMVLQGRAEVQSEFGCMTVEAGHISVSPPGVKRVVLALEDTKFVTVHVNPSNTQDLEIIEAEHIESEIKTLTTNTQEKLQ